MTCNLTNVARELDRLRRDRREAASKTLRYSQSKEDDGQAGVRGPSGAWTVSLPSLWLVALSLDRRGAGPHLSNVLCGDVCGREGGAAATQSR